MDDKIVIKGVPPYDGEYPIDFETLTMGELRLLKRVAGVTLGNLSSALGDGDSDVVVAFAVIALERAGKDVDEEALWKAQLGEVNLKLADRSGDADPPAVAASEPLTSSGSSSAQHLDESLEIDPSFTGAPV